MSGAFDLDALATQLCDAQVRVRQIPPFTACLPDFDVAAAYAVANLVHRQRISQGAASVGRKIGFSNAALWPIYGVTEPIWGHLYDSTVEFVSHGRARCALRQFPEPLIEPEIVVHFGAAPEPGGSLPELLASIDWIAHGFEIVQSPFPGWKFGTADTIAAGAMHARLIVGEPCALDRLCAGDVAQCLADFSLSLFRGGALVDAGTGANVLGSPLRAIAHLMDVLSKQPASLPLRAGELVTTGTITAAHPVCAGERWHTEIAGIALPGLDIEFA